MTKGTDMRITNAADLERVRRIYEGDLALQSAGIKAHAIKRAGELGLASDDASITGIACPECPGRTFYSDQAFLDHAKVVHTYNDIQQMVGDRVRELYGREGDYRATPPVAAIWTYISDMTDDWVVYCVDGPSESQLYQATYSIDDNNNVTLGDPVEVVRRTAYDPVTPSAT